MNEKSKMPFLAFTWMCLLSVNAWASSGTDLTNKYAWAENIGWVHFKGTAPDYNVRTLAFDTQPKGTPNWWLDLYGIGSETNGGADSIRVTDLSIDGADNGIRIKSMRGAGGPVDPRCRRRLSV